MDRTRGDPLLGLGVLVTLGLLALAWTRLPGSERLALLPVSVSSLGTGLVVALVGRLEDRHRAVANATAQALTLQAAVAAAALAFGWDLPRALSVGTGLALIVTGNATSRARPGEWFGFRTRWALLSERAWYATQRRAAPALVVTGAVFTAFAALTPAGLLVPWVQPVGLLALLLPVVFSLHRASYQDYLRDPERRPAVPGARRRLPPLTPSERVLAALTLGLPLLSLTACLLALPLLPGRVPLHFGPDGRPDRFGSPVELLVIPLFALGMGLFFRGVTRFGSATPAQRHLTLLMGAMVGGLTAPIPLSVGGDLHLSLGLMHALMLAVFAVGLWLPGADGRRRVRGAVWVAAAALLTLALALLLPERGGEALGTLLLALGGPIFLAPVLVYGVNPGGRAAGS